MGIHQLSWKRYIAGEIPRTGNVVVGDDLIDIVLAGGYPEALTRSKWGRRQDWHLDYIEAVVQREVRDIAQIEQIHIMPKLLRVSGGTLRTACQLFRIRRASGRQPRHHSKIYRCL